MKTFPYKVYYNSKKNNFVLWFESVLGYYTEYQGSPCPGRIKASLPLKINSTKKLLEGGWVYVGKF